jgi:hypothetical protein
MHSCPVGKTSLSRAAYDAEQSTVNELRELANRDTELREAPGQMAAIATRLAEIAQEIERIPSEHRVAYDLAEAQARQVDDKLRLAHLALYEAERDREEIIGRREQAWSLEQTIGYLACLAAEHRQRDQ